MAALVIKHLLEAYQPDQLYIEEIMLTVLHQVIKNAYGGKHVTAKTKQKDAHNELVHEVNVSLLKIIKRN